MPELERSPARGLSVTSCLTPRRVCRKRNLSSARSGNEGVTYFTGISGGIKISGGIGTPVRRRRKNGLSLALEPEELRPLRPPYFCQYNAERSGLSGAYIRSKLAKSDVVWHISLDIYPKIYWNGSGYPIRSSGWPYTYTGLNAVRPLRGARALFSARASFQANYKRLGLSQIRSRESFSELIVD